MATFGKRAQFGGLLVAATLLLSSCQAFSVLFGVSIDQRINDFNSDLRSASYADLYTNFSASQTAMYGDLKAPSFWKELGPFSPAERPGRITNTTIEGSMVRGSYSNGAGGNYVVTLAMVQDGIDWYIGQMTLTPVVTHVVESTGSTPPSSVVRIF